LQVWQGADYGFSELDDRLAEYSTSMVGHGWRLWLKSDERRSAEYPKPYGRVGWVSLLGINSFSCELGLIRPSFYAIYELASGGIRAKLPLAGTLILCLITVECGVTLNVNPRKEKEET
jgi:hypothetical protein